MPQPRHTAHLVATIEPEQLVALDADAARRGLNRSAALRLILDKHLAGEACPPCDAQERVAASRENRRRTYIRREGTAA